MFEFLRRLLFPGSRRPACRPPAVGPILGALTEDGTRIFCQWRPEAGEAYAHLVVWSLEGRAGPNVFARKTLRLNPNFAHSAIFVVEGLSAGQLYAYRVGVFNAADPDGARRHTDDHPLPRKPDLPVFCALSAEARRHRIVSPG